MTGAKFVDAVHAMCVAITLKGELDHLGIVKADSLKTADILSWLWKVKGAGGDSYITE